MIKVFNRIMCASCWRKSIGHLTSGRLFASSRASLPLDDARHDKKVEMLTELKSAPSLQHLPGPKPSFPFIGTGWQYFRWSRYNLYKLHEANLDKYRRYGPIVKEEYQWRRPVVHLFKPEDFETVFRHQGKYPLRPVSEFLKYYRLNNPHKYDNAGLVNSVGEEWYRLRSALTPVLMKMKSLHGMLSHQNEICDDFLTFVRRIREKNTNQIINLQDLLYRLALESICVMCMDCRLGSLDPELKPDSDAQIMISASKKMFEAYQKLYYGLPLWKYFKTPAYQKLDEAESAIYRSASKYIEKALKRIEDGTDKKNNKHNSILETLVQVNGLSDKETRMAIIDFISGGIFTVTNTMCFLLYHLAKNNDVQGKLYQELKRVIPDGEITTERLANLQYLKACVKETFRLTPTVPCLTRILPEDVTLSGYLIPAGTPLFCHFKVSCELSENFPSPKSFWPERWLNNRNSIHPFCMLPFGFGNRMCVGRRFTEMELYITIAKIIQNFQLETVHDELGIMQAFITVPSHPVSIKFHDR